ncbi:alanyl-tRNA editing protein [Kosakonia sp. BK9b]
MTERLYYTSDTLTCTAQVLRCEAQDDGRYTVVLNKTVFHPQGGGQPADNGTIAGIAVEAVLQHGDEVWHILSSVLPATDDPVELNVDAASRMLHSRLHTAGHLIGYAGELLGWQPVKAHHWPGEGRITFKGGDEAILPEASALLVPIADWQSADLVRHIVFKEGRREVRFGELPAYGCGGTHLHSLAALGQVTISQIKIKKGQLIVSYAVE